MHITALGPKLHPLVCTCILILQDCHQFCFIKLFILWTFDVILKSCSHVYSWFLCKIIRFYIISFSFVSVHLSFCTKHSTGATMRGMWRQEAANWLQHAWKYQFAGGMKMLMVLTSFRFCRFEHTNTHYGVQWKPCLPPALISASTPNI